MLDGRPCLLNIALLPFTGVLWFLYRGTRLEAEAQVKVYDGAQRP